MPASFVSSSRRARTVLSLVVARLRGTAEQHAPRKLAALTLSHKRGNGAGKGHVMHSDAPITYPWSSNGQTARIQICRLGAEDTVSDADWGSSDATFEVDVPVALPLVYLNWFLQVTGGSAKTYPESESSPYKFQFFAQGNEERLDDGVLLSQEFLNSCKVGDGLPALFALPKLRSEVSADSNVAHTLRTKLSAAKLSAAGYGNEEIETHLNRVLTVEVKFRNTCPQAVRADLPPRRVSFQFAAFEGLFAGKRIGTPGFTISVVDPSGTPHLLLAGEDRENRGWETILSTSGLSEWGNMMQITKNYGYNFDAEPETGLLFWRGWQADNTHTAHTGDDPRRTAMRWLHTRQLALDWEGATATVIADEHVDGERGEEDAGDWRRQQSVRTFCSGDAHRTFFCSVAWS